MWTGLNILETGEMAGFCRCGNESCGLNLNVSNNCMLT
jgi:hypothetical protein